MEDHEWKSRAEFPVYTARPHRVWQGKGDEPGGICPFRVEGLHFEGECKKSLKN